MSSPGRPPLSQEEKDTLFRKLEPHLMTGMSLHKACLKAKVPSSTVYDIYNNDAEFSEKIEVAKSHQAVLVHNILSSELQRIAEAQNSGERKSLSKDELRFVQWMATNSPATREDFSKPDKELTFLGYTQEHIEDLILREKARDTIASNTKAMETILASAELLRRKQKP